MANNISEILGRDINSVKELKDAIKGLQDSLVGLDTESEEYKQTAQQLVAAQDTLRQTTRAGIETNTAAKDSIVGMEQAYKNLYTQYKQLSDEQRNSDFGKNMAASLEQLSNKLNETKQGVGNFKDNIGRYTDSVVGAFDKMGISIGALKGPLSTAKSGAEGLGKTFSALAKNPWMIALGALITILTEAAEAIKKNEELSNRLNVAMSAFKPVLDAVANAFDFLAGLLVKTVEGLTKVAEKVMSFIPGMKKAIQSHKELAQATNDLTKAQREANVENSKKTAEIERLREEASATEDVNEKKKLLLEAKELQAEVDQQNIELAQEELRILQEYGEKTANSAEENEKLAAAQEKVNQAIAQGERNQRMYNKQLAATTNSTSKAGSSAKNYREEAKKLLETLEEENKTELQKVQEKYEMEKKLLEKYHLDTTLLTKKYNAEIARINEEAREKERQERIQHNLDIYNRDENSWQLFINSTSDNVEKAKREMDHLKYRIDDMNKMLEEFKKHYSSTFRTVGSGVTNDEWFDEWKENFSNMFGKIDSISDALKVSLDYQNKLKESQKQYADEVVKSYDDAVDSVNEYIASIDVMFHKYRFEEEGGQNAIQTVVNKMIEDLNNIGAEIEPLSEDFWENLLSEDEAKKAFEELSEELYGSIEKISKNVFGKLNILGDEEKTMVAMQKYISFIQTAYAAYEEAEYNLNQTRIDSFLDVSDAINTVSNSISQLINNEIQSGKITQEQAEKKKKALKALEGVMLAVNLAQIAVTTNSAIMDVWKSYAAELAGNAATAAATGPAFAATKAALDAKSHTAAILRTIGIAANGAASVAASIMGTIAKIKSINDSGESGNGSGVEGTLTTPTLIDSTPYSYYRQLQTAEEEDRLNQPIYVTVTDIQEGLSHRAQVVDESSF